MKIPPFPLPVVLAALLGCSFPLDLPAQAPPSGGGDGQEDSGGGGAREEEGLREHWEFVSSSGKFIVRLDRIASVSLEEYLIDGALRVRECSVSTTGPVVARFYHIEPVAEEVEDATTGTSTLEKLRDVANRVGQKTGVGEIDNTVTKHYPDTTHAKTAEYRLEQKETIDQIYEHLYRVWAEGIASQRNRLVVE